MTSAALSIAASAIPEQPMVNGTGDDYWTITLTTYGNIHSSICGTLAELDEALIRIGEAVREAHGRARMRVDDRRINEALAERALAGIETEVTQ
jgi:hypothetical protein